MLVFRWFKRLMCRHEKLTYSSTFLDEVGYHEYKTHHVWKCKECGKEFY